MAHPLDQTDPIFVADLKRSDKAARYVAEWLRRFGKHVVVNPLRIRPDPSQRMLYSDFGDLRVDGLQRIEVKERHLPFLFKSRDEFRYKTIIVDVAHSWDRAVVKPHAYVFLNNDWSGCLVLKGETRGEWFRKIRWDSHCNRDREFYECPVALTTYYSITGA